MGAMNETFASAAVVASRYSLLASRNREATTRSGCSERKRLQRRRSRIERKRLQSLPLLYRAEAVAAAALAQRAEAVAASGKFPK